MIKKYLIEIDTDEKGLKDLAISDILWALDEKGIKVKSITEVK